MSYNKIGKKSGEFCVLCALLMVLLIAGQSVRADDCPCHTPTTPPGGGPSHLAGDPVFMLADPKPATTLAMAQAGLTSGTTVTPQQLNEKDRAVLKDVENRIQAKPDTAFTEALTVWKGAYSKDLQNAVVLVAMKAARSTDEQGMLRFMLDLLNDPAAQRQEISKLGRGNKLEQKIAEKRLTVLNQNPQLAAK